VRARKFKLACGNGKRRQQPAVWPAFKQVHHRINGDDLEILIGVKLELHRRNGYAVNMKVRLVIEFDPESKRWSAVFPELPGCASAGDTEKEAIANAKEALALWFEPSPVEFSKGAKLLEVALP
jgi:predicted RNase H-like HicB family nuclease